LRRVWLIAGIAAVIIGLWWLAEDGGFSRWSTLRGGGDRPQPSWGDVAGKVGEFAKEERDLQDAIDPEPPPPAPASPE
jgi:hypothetical protein